MENSLVLNVDSLPPSIPAPLLPSSGSYLNTGTITLMRGTGIDSGAGMSGYVYQISTGSTFTSFIKSGTVLSTGATVTGLTENTYYRRVYAYDVLGNTGTRSTTTPFNIDMTIPIVVFTGSTPSSGTISS